MTIIPVSSSWIIRDGLVQQLGVLGAAIGVLSEPPKKRGPKPRLRLDAAKIEIRRRITERR